MVTEGKDMAEWYFKAENVVVSSMTLGQLETARNYVEMYLIFKREITNIQ